MVLLSLDKVDLREVNKYCLKKGKWLSAFLKKSDYELMKTVVKRVAALESVSAATVCVNL